MFRILFLLLLFCNVAYAAPVVCWNHDGTIKRFFPSANTPDYQNRTDCKVFQTTASATQIKQLFRDKQARYLKHKSGNIEEMTQAEKDTVDANILQAQNAELSARVDQLEVDNVTLVTGLLRTIGSTKTKDDVIAQIKQDLGLTSPPPPPAPVGSHAYLGDGAWTFIHDPRTLFYSGVHNKTYVAYNGRRGEFMISSYDHDVDFWDTFQLRDAIQWDDHNNPGIYIRPDGRILAVYTGHGTGTIYSRISTNPEDISSFQPQVGITAAVGNSKTYSNLYNIGNTVYLIYRNYSNGEWRWYYVKSEDDGDTWSENTLIWHRSSQGRAYIRPFSNGIRIDFLATHTHAPLGNQSLYHFYFDGTDFYNSNGVKTSFRNDGVTQLGMPPIDRRNLDRSISEIYDGPNGCWYGDLTYGADGHPRVIYPQYPASNDHDLYYTRWNGTNWTPNYKILDEGTGFEKVDSPYYHGAATFDRENPNAIYLATEVNGIYEIQRWESTDGDTWAKHSDITTGSTFHNFRPITPDNYREGDKATLFFLGGGAYPGWDEYETKIAYYPS
jgi:hypothetical protein